MLSGRGGARWNHALVSPRAGLLGGVHPIGYHTAASPSVWIPTWRSSIPIHREVGLGSVMAWSALYPHPRLAWPAWAGLSARLPVRPHELCSHALLIPPGTCPSSRRLRASKEPINPPGARGSGSGSSGSPANEGRGRAGCWVAGRVSAPLPCVLALFPPHTPHPPCGVVSG